MYTLNPKLTSPEFSIAIAGCGGTGSFVAEHLCRFLPKEVSLILVDPDHIEDRNLIRQNFLPNEIGEYKSAALAKRLSSRYNRAIAYSTFPVGMLSFRYNSIIVGCVDNGMARQQIESIFKQYPHPTWWIDAGNGQNYGQVIIGNTSMISECKPDLNDRWNYLPLPTLQQPGLLQQVPEPGCAEINEQGPTINQAMAVLLLEVIRRLINGTCPWIQLYLNLEQGFLQPTLATPDIVASICKKIRKEVIDERSYQNRNLY